MKIPVHECTDCGARLATAAGLSIHESMTHSPAAARFATPGPDVHRLSFSPDRPRRVRARKSPLPAVRLVATLIVVLLIAGVVAAVHVHDVHPSGPTHVASASGTP